MGRSPGRRDSSDRQPRDRRSERSQQWRSRSRDRHRDGHDRNHHRQHDDYRNGSSHDYGYDERPTDRRDRSRDRKRHREASPVKDRRAEHGHYRDRDDRDNKRARRQHSPEDRQRSSRYDGKAARNSGSSPPRKTDRRDHPVSGSHFNRAPTEMDKQAQRLARVHAMKQQQDRAGFGGGGRNAEGSEVVASARNTTSSNNGTSSRPASASTGQPRTFDHAAIQERAAAKLAEGRARQAKALGSDIVVPKSTNDSAPQREWKTKPAGSHGAAGTGFSSIGLGKSLQDKSVKMSAKTAAGLEDDDDGGQGSRKLELLPEMPTNLDNTQPTEQDDDNDEQIISDDEGSHNANALENAQRRAEEAQKSLHDDFKDNEPAARYSRNDRDTQDTAMLDADEEDDPLDAFMKTLEMPTDHGDILSDVRSGKGRKKVFTADDEDAYNDVDPSTLGKITNHAKKSAKKDLPKVDHSKIDYEDFRKEFYKPSVELTSLTQEEVDNMRLELDNIKVKGKDVPTPIQSFGQGGFGAQILDIMKDHKFDAPTAIQAQALPAIMSGRDVIGVAKTGSGKTMAYLLPMFRHVKNQRPVDNMEGPIGLILAPTRELVTQIFKECKPFLEALGLRGICAYGGSPLQDCINDFKRGGEIVVATAGRFIDVLSANNGRVTNLRRVTYVVLDEADRMFDMGFEPTITRILGNIRPDRQTVLFSATFPKSMETLARKALKNSVEIVVGGRSVVAPEIEQIVEVRDQKDKLKRTLELLGELHALTDNDDRSLIFVERQENADSLNVALTKRGYTVRAVHGGHDQIDRDQWISDFKDGTLPTLIATSVAARGLDVRQLKLVINWDCPNHNEDYVHRCGRTGRAGQNGTAVTYITPEQDQFAPFLVKALTASKKPVPEELQELADKFEKKVKEGLAKKNRAGFGGKGVERLNVARAAQRARERKIYAGPDDDDEEVVDDKQASATDDKSKAKDPAALVAAAASGVTARDAPASPPENSMKAHLHQLLRDAMVVRKTEAPKPSKSESNEPPKLMDKKAKLAAAMRNIENRISGKGNARGAPAADKRGPDAGEFSATLQVNDFPQKARWGVTNRSNVAKILDATGTSITTKGNFYPAGQEPGEGDPPKLYILVEGETQIAVETAMRELTERLLSGIEQDQIDTANKPAGRYTVI